MSPNPISFTEIDAYCRLHRLALSSREVDLLRRIDVVAMRAAHSKAGSDRPVDQDEPRASGADVAETKMRIRLALADRRVVTRTRK